MASKKQYEEKTFGFIKKGGRKMKIPARVVITVASILIGLLEILVRYYPRNNYEDDYYNDYYD